MKLYKYKSLANFEFVADILINKRLYAAHFEELNDPMEGDFYKNEADREYVELITKEMEKIRILSLSKNMYNTLLWSHYADGYKGICIELEIDESVLDVHKINYNDFNVMPTRDYRGLNGEKEVTSVYDWALSALRGKYSQWEYEDEYRIISDSRYLEKGFKITAIYFGVRTSETYKELIKKILPDEVEIKNTIILDGGCVIKTLDLKLDNIGET